ncbi:MAG: hypothetical protein MJ053_06835 [Elusimicrobiaceae bacterium]|nr:hypothetical protein [Elusimicrobiaceae bacterium]
MIGIRRERGGGPVVRDPLRAKFGQEELDALERKALDWSDAQFNRKKHELVELRRAPFLVNGNNGAPIEARPTIELDVRPMGLKRHEKWWRNFGEFGPASFGEKELDEIVKEFWRKRKWVKDHPTIGANSDECADAYADGAKRVRRNNSSDGAKTIAAIARSNIVDFTDESHLYGILKKWKELAAIVEREQFGEQMGDILRTLEYYADNAELTDVYRMILKGKMAGKSNAELREVAHETYGKNYGENYISTIFTNKIIPAIAAAARKHMDIVENLPFSENYKKCTCCGRILLKNSDNFTKCARSNDGWQTRCKTCEHAARANRK